MKPSFIALIQSRKIWSRLIINFFIWMVPGIFALVIFLVILLISFSGSDGSLLQIEVNPPKGLMSFMSIGLIAVSTVIFSSIGYFAPVSLESGLELSFFGMIVLFFGVLFFYIEMKRIHFSLIK